MSATSALSSTTRMVPWPETMGWVGGACTLSTGAARLMGKAIDLRQSKTGAFPERFGREERLENPRQYVRRNADAGVCHRKGDEVSLKLIHRVALLKAHVSRGQRD